MPFKSTALCWAQPFGCNYIYNVRARFVPPYLHDFSSAIYSLRAGWLHGCRNLNIAILRDKRSRCQSRHNGKTLGALLGARTMQPRIQSSRPASAITSGSGESRIGGYISHCTCLDTRHICERAYRLF